MAAGAGSGKLTLSSSVTGDGTLDKWQYQQKDTGNFGSWQEISETSTTLSHVVSGLTDGTDYQFKVRAVNASGDGADSDASDAAQPAAVTLTASAITQATATLTLAGHAGSWYYQYTSPAGGSCSSTAVTGPTVALANLKPNTSYTYKAYSDSACQTALASTASVTFKTPPAAGPVVSEPQAAPPAPSKPSATAGDGEVSLRWTSGGDGGSAITKWQYVKQEGGGEFETDWTDMPDSGPDTTSFTVTGLTNGADYRFKVRAVNTAGPGAASPASDAVTPAESVPALPAAGSAVLLLLLATARLLSSRARRP